MANTGNRDHARVRRGAKQRGVLLGALAVGVTLLAPWAAAHAETLKEALVSAYLANPQLKAQQAAQRATDEDVARAKSGFRPNVSAKAEYSAQDVRTKLSGGAAANSAASAFLGNGTSYPQAYSVAVTQPLFRGFRTVNAVRGAEAAVEAGRETLRSVEQQVLLSAVQAYADVVRDLTVVKLRENNVKVLSEQLKAEENRFTVGEVTKTDVAQSTASLSGGQSDLALAKANLQSSRANYERVIGHAPGRLADPRPIDRLLPRSVEAALKIGEGEHPDVLVALFRERAQDHAIDQARGELLPQVNLQGSYTKTFNPQSGEDSQEIGVVGASISVPLYQSGEVGARIRQNVELRSQLRQLIDAARLQVRSGVSSAWSQLIAVKSQIAAYKAQVEANKVALEGVRQEEKVGQRTVLDILNAQQALLNSQVLLETAKRDEVVASHAVLSAMGRLYTGALGLPVATYDPSAHYNEVKDKVLDWDTHVDHADEPAVGAVAAPKKGKDHPNGPAY